MGTSDEAPKSLPALDFSTFVLSLGSSCMINLGQVQSPDAPASEANLPAAKQMIDILALLQDKTEGNLDESESKLLSSLLYDLRVQYVDAQNKK